MKGTKIELKDRTGITKTTRQPPEIHYTTSKYTNSYTFRFDKPYRRRDSKCEPALAVTKIEFPADVGGFNTGSSLEKWAQKRPRLKNKPIVKPPPVETSSEDEELQNYLEINNNKFQDVQDDFSEEEVEEEEVDYDVQQLILSAERFEANSGTELELPNKKKRKRKHKKSKTVKFALSKPQSPQSVQVIRVDVTSSCSYDEREDDSSGDDYRQRFADLIDEENEDDDEFTVVCQKLALLPRE